MWIGTRRPFSFKICAFHDEPTTTASKCCSAALFVMRRNQIGEVCHAGMRTAAQRRRVARYARRFHMTRRAGRLAKSSARYRSCRGPICDVSSKNIRAIFGEPMARGLPIPPSRLRHQKPKQTTELNLHPAPAIKCPSHTRLRFLRLRHTMSTLVGNGIRRFGGMSYADF